MMRPMPLYRMNSATARPIQPSSTRWVAWPSASAASTAAVLMTSFRLSVAVACRVEEPMRLPMARLNTAIHSFTPMLPTSTATVSQLKATGVGCKILSRLVRASSKPMTMISTETASPARYSMRAWP